MKLFEPYQFGDICLKNRIVMPPMCMYSAAGDGKATDFHFTHYTARAVGGAGLIIVESTGICPEGRISGNDLGLWDDGQVDGLKSIVRSCHGYGAKIAVQLNHAGRKCTADVPEIFAPSALAFREDSRVPSVLTGEQIAETVTRFRSAAVRAKSAGFDALEIHAAHGYLLHQFLSPLSNRRTDEYGGSVAGRTRLLTEVLRAVRSVWSGPLSLRVSASDYDPAGIDAGMMVEIIDLVRQYADIVHVSSGGLTPHGVRDYPGYQVPFSEKIRSACGVPTIAVGKITQAEMAEEILQNGRADLVAFGRELLRNPYFPLAAAVRGHMEGAVPVPYERAF